MFGSEVLEVAIGLSLLFLLISLMCSAVQEAIESVIKTRAMHLEWAIREMLSDRSGASVTQELFKHPLIFSLFNGDYDHDHLRGDDARRHMPIRDRRNLPSYIPAANFAGAFLDIWAKRAPGGETSLTSKTLRKAIPHIHPRKLRRAARSALNRADGDIEKTKANLEEWFNTTMDRVTGWYKRRTQLMLFLIGLAVAAVINIDAITVTQHLMRDKSLREAVVGQAKSIDNKEPKNNFDDIKANLDKVGYPVGWKDFVPAPQGCTDAKDPNAAKDPKNAAKDPKNAAKDPKHAKCIAFLDLGWTWLQIVIGWLVTAVAVTLGAPFWFDVLNKFMLLRSTLSPKQARAKHDHSSSGKKDKDQAPAAA
jgi:hypothetical protein